MPKKVLLIGVLLSSECLAYLDFSGYSPTRISTSLVTQVESIIKRNDYNALIELINANCFDINSIGFKMDIKTNISNFVYHFNNNEWLFNYDIWTSDKLTSLMIASIYAKPHIISLLLQSEANPNYNVTYRGERYYPLRMAYGENFDNDNQHEALVQITQHFIKTRISLEHLKQALKFVEEVIAISNRDLAQRLHILLQEELGNISLSNEY